MENVEKPRIHKLIQLRTKSINPARSADVYRTWAWVVALRLLLAFGFVVFLVGRCRSGKTYLAERATPGKVVDGSLGWKHPGGAMPLNPALLPQGAFTLDELTGFNREDLRNAVGFLAKRSFIGAVQPHSCVPVSDDQTFIGSLLQQQGRRIVLLELA